MQISPSLIFLGIGIGIFLIILIFLTTRYKKVRGEGDAISASNYAKAYSQDVEFYSFYRSLESYKKSFNEQGDILVLNPDSEFFRHFNPTD